MSEPTVTVNPTEQLIAAANATHEVKDSTGRSFALRDPGPLAQYRLVEILGDTAKNEVFMGMSLPLLYINAIDGELLPPPSNRAQLDALIQRLGNPGIAAIMQGVNQYFGPQDPEADKAKIKN